jgi:hypothetical protein
MRAMVCAGVVGEGALALPPFGPLRLRFSFGVQQSKLTAVANAVGLATTS